MNICAKCANRGCEWCQDPPAFRPWLALRYEQIKRLAPLISLGIQSATLAGVAYALLSPQNPILLPLLMAAIVALASAAAALWYGPLGMRDAEQTARFEMDTRDQGRLSPKEKRLLLLWLRIEEGDDKAHAEVREAIIKGRL